MNRGRWFFVCVLSLFIVSTAICLGCYAMAWKGGYMGIIGMFLMTMWIGLARFIQKVLKEAFDV